MAFMAHGDTQEMCGSKGCPQHSAMGKDALPGQDLSFLWHWPADLGPEPSKPVVWQSLAALADPIPA